jgi:hypothetical protein
MAGKWAIFENGFRVPPNQFKSKEEAKLVIAFIKRGNSIDVAIEKSGVRR